jgi:23S rRNA (guanosine2251-2'-O)-methyltransferase
MPAPAPNRSTARIFGIHPLLEALAAGRPFEAIYVARGRGGPELQQVIDAARARGVAVRFESREVLDRMVGHGKHQGVLGLGAERGYLELDDLLAAVPAGKTALFVLDGIEDPRNFGAILRTADAAGFHGAIIPERRAAGITDAVVKASAGAVEYVPVARVVNLTRAIEELKRRNIWVYGLDPAGAKSYLEVDYTGSVALVIGGEGAGIGRLVRESCDELIAIPMRGHVASLNASVAAAVLAYEVLRQRLSR